MDSCDQRGGLGRADLDDYVVDALCRGVQFGEVSTECLPGAIGAQDLQCPLIGPGEGLNDGREVG